VRICRGFEVVDVHRTSRLDNFTSANKILPGIARDWHQTRDGMTTVSDLDRFPGGYYFEVPACVLPQLPYPYGFHVLHRSTCDMEGLLAAVRHIDGRPKKKTYGLLSREETRRSFSRSSASAV